MLEDVIKTNDEQKIQRYLEEHSLIVKTMEKGNMVSLDSTVKYASARNHV